MKELSRREQNKIDKQNRILGAAIKVFAQTGYSGASMDVIATEAGLSKPTLYQYFPSKEELFQAMMVGQRDLMMQAFETGDATGMTAQLYSFAWRYADTVMRPDFLSLARLIIGEAHRFPEIGKDYQSSGPDRVLKGLMAFMEQQRAAGRLAFDDAELAAQDFWGLILSAPRNRALYAPDETITRKSLARYIDNGLGVFLRAYSTQPSHDLDQLAELRERTGAKTPYA